MRDFMVSFFVNCFKGFNYLLLQQTSILKFWKNCKYHIAYCGHKYWYLQSMILFSTPEKLLHQEHFKLLCYFMYDIVCIIITDGILIGTCFITTFTISSNQSVTIGLQVPSTIFWTPGLPERVLCNHPCLSVVVRGPSVSPLVRL